MRLEKIILAAVVGASSVLVTSIAAGPTAYAQSATSGAIQGIVKDKASGDALAGVTVVVSSAGGGGTPTALTDDKGFYKIGDLRPGTYLVTFYYADITLEHNNVNVGLNKTTPVYLTIDTNQAGGEVVHVTDTAPTIDPTSTTQGITLDQEYTKNIPVPGRTFESALGAAAGSQSDGLGVSFSGSSSLENQYIVDGVNTTGLRYGTVGSPVINDFIEEIEVITGGYNAEYGRATGGVVNVVTKSGTNEFKGEIFGSLSPGALIAARERTPSQVTSIDAEANVAYQADFGFLLGGPIIKDKAWFFFGFGPAFSRVDVTRRIKRETDCRKVLPDGTLSQQCDPRSLADGGFGDGNADRDPATGFFITDELDNRTVKQPATSYSILGKLNFAISPEHQGQISFQGAPASGRFGGIYGLPESTTYDYSALTTDTSAKWTSKFNDNKTEIEAVVGWHRDSAKQDALDNSLNTVASQTLVFGNLGTWSGFGGESPGVVKGCTDGGPDDPYGIVNCPDDGVGYAIGGPGGLVNDVEQRYSAKLSATERLKALGSHEIKAGLDVENNTMDRARLLSGGAAFTNNVASSQVQVVRWVQLAPKDTDPATTRFDNMCGDTTLGQLFQCDYLGGTPGSPGTQVEGNTLNVGAYLRDSWQIQPNLTLNAGLRYEAERLRYAKALQGTIDGLTQRQLGKNAMSLDNMWAPRLGLLYDWTKEGRSKIYAHWGRFYESIPMDINDRSFGGELLDTGVYRSAAGNGKPNQCGATDPRIGAPDGNGCIADPSMRPGIQETLVGQNGVLVQPGIKAQYLDEVIGGVEYELIEDLKVGISFQNRKLGRVIEDVSPDGAQTYIIANPGEWSADEEAKLNQQIMNTDDVTTKATLQHQLDLYKSIAIYDKPRRDYNALTFTVTRRFSKSLYLQGSYTYSRSEGNYPGLFSSNNGQVDPNISSQYDLIELLANRQGPLPGDRPHYIKIDGYYTFDLKKYGQLTIGGRYRALSGVPKDTLAAHYLYGPNESFLLPRGEIGRTDFDHGLDTHVGYGRDLGRGMNLEVFADLFNVYNRQGQAGVDDTYAFSYGGVNNANPIVGGTYEDLIWAKSNTQDGLESAAPKPGPLLRNPNFGNTNARYGPFSARFGMRLSFSSARGAP